MIEPVWIEERDVLAFHDRLLAIHGGAAGVRDSGLLQSALARAKQHLAYAEQPDPVELAGLYTIGIGRNHPFIDGNERNRIGNLCALYQGGRPEVDLEQLAHQADQLRIVGGSVSWAEVERRSSKTGQRHSLGGFTGWVEYEGDASPFLPWLQAARWTGVGRQTVWGKGWIESSVGQAARSASSAD